MDENLQDRINMMIVKLQKTFPIRVTEWLLACIMFSWSFALYKMPPEGFANPIYAGLARLAHADTWATFAFLIGGARIAALTINGAWRPSPHLRAAGAFLACFMWLQISIGQFMADQPTLAIAIYPWLLIADIYNVFRASYDARLSDDRARVTSGRGRQEGANATAH